MARKQILQVACSNPVAAFRHIKDFLLARNGIADYSTTGVGWTVADSSFAGGSENAPATNDWVVLASNGEASTYPTYLKLTCTSGNLEARMYLLWDATNHTGMVEAWSATNINNGATTCSLSVFASLDYAHIVVQPSGSNYWYWCPLGRISADLLAYDGEAVQSTAAASAGSNVVITCASIPTVWVVGTKLYCWSAAGIEEVTIGAIDAETNTITVAGLAVARPVGSWLVEDMCIFAGESAQGSTIYITGAPSRVLLTADIRTYLRYGGASTYADDAKYGDRVAEHIAVTTTNQQRGMMPGVLATTTIPTPYTAWTERRSGRRFRLVMAYSNINLAFEE